MNEKLIKDVLKSSYGKYSIIKNHKNIANREEALKSCWLASVGLGETWIIIFNR